MKNLIYTFFFLILTPVIYAQNYYITDNNTVNTCSGVLELGNDTSGQTYVTTICSNDIANGNSHISVALNQYSIVNGILCVYDGNSTVAPQLGCNAWQIPWAITATAANTTGCLTFEYTTLATGDVFGGDIHCNFMCEYSEIQIVATNPVFVVEDSANYINICSGDSVTFTVLGGYANITYPQADSTSVFFWDFGDGDTLSGVNLTSVSHIFTGSQGYVVEVYLKDQKGCMSSNKIQWRIRVSGVPQINIQDTPVICPCMLASLSSNIYEDSVVVADYQETETHDTTYIPDGSGASYTYSIFVDEFYPNQTITTINDLISICATMEHSYLGDLDIQITCPNGTTVTMESNSASPNAGNAYLGIPNQIDDQNPIYQGTGWDYCWSTNPTYGVMNDVAQNYNGSSMPSGSYTSYQPLSDLVGCPLNGLWTLTITDNWAIDDGWIFGWGIEFNPSLYQNHWSYQNSIVSQVWSAPAPFGEILSDDGNGNATGTYYCGQPHPVMTAEPFVLTVTDNFGCSYTAIDSIVVVSDTTNCCYIPALNIITPSQSVCGDSMLLEASIEQGYNGIWSYTGPGTATLIQDTVTTWVHVDTPGDYNFVYSYGQPGCDTSDAVTITFNAQPVVQGHLITPNNTVVIYSYQGTNSIYPHDSLVVSSSAFSMITDTGEYFFKVSYQNSQSMYPDIYYDNTFFWQLAQPVQMTCGDTAYLSIYLHSIVVNSSGNGQLHGHIYFENSLLPFRNASVFLVDSISGEIINYTRSDTNGNYSFYNVPDGHYYFTVDIFSLKQISTHYIFLTSGNNILTYLDFKIDTFINTRNSYGIYAVNGQNGINTTGVSSISIFPNPVSDFVYIQSPQEKIHLLKITNVTGKILLTKQGVFNNVTLNISNLKTGIYFITIQTQNNTFVKPLIVN